MSKRDLRKDNDIDELKLEDEEVDENTFNVKVNVT